jgi:hypothetical protein
MEREIGYVVVEFNQASHQPEFSAFPDLTQDRSEADERRDLLERENRKVGRRERFAVATVTIEEEE